MVNIIRQYNVFNLLLYVIVTLENAVLSHTETKKLAHTFIFS